MDLEEREAERVMAPKHDEDLHLLYDVVDLHREQEEQHD